MHDHSSAGFNPHESFLPEVQQGHDLALQQHLPSIGGHLPLRRCDWLFPRNNASNHAKRPRQHNHLVHVRVPRGQVQPKQPVAQNQNRVREL